MDKTELIIKGSIAGLTLSFLIGPVFFAILQAGIERGFRAGIMLCLGIWVSDLSIILLAYLGLSYILMLVQWDGFHLWVGSIGGLILITFGFSAVFSRPSVAIEKSSYPKKRTHNIKLFTKGFLVNTFNPFTIVFWLGLMSTIVVQSAQSVGDASTFFGSLLVVMIGFDVAKVALSKKIRGWISPSSILKVRKTTGIMLLIFGIILLVRVWINTAPA
jgi:threonine/homoserine/homoserine lactone efflux protein